MQQLLRRHILTVAWLFSALLLSVYVVKTVHAINTEIAASQGGQSHNPDDCDLCQFMLSPGSETTPTTVCFYGLQPIEVAATGSVSTTTGVQSVCAVRGPPMMLSENL